jgi:hypothetical protein
MVARFVIPAVVVLGAAWVLVQPDTPRPAETASVATPVPVEAESAVELLGETWTVDAPAPTAPPGPVVRPLTAAEHAAAIAALRQSASEAGPQVRAVEQAESLRRPMPRPVRPADVREVAVVSTQSPRPANAGEVVILHDGGANPPAVLALRGGPFDRSEAVALHDAPSAMGLGHDTGARWVVRQQGSGAVIAEVPLAEALAILSSR